MKGGKVRIVCPGCRTEYDFSHLGLVKLLRKPNCERCGANLLDKAKEQMLPMQAQSSGRAVCPRCNQEQDAAEHCKWCGAVMSRSAGWRERLPGGLGKAEPPPGEAQRRGSPLRKLVGFVPLILFAVVSLAFSELPKQIYEAYRVAEPVVRDSQRLSKAVGGHLEIGPIPVFYQQETDPARRQVTASLYFWVKGPAVSTLVCARLRRPMEPRVLWQMGEDSYFRGPDGKEMPLMETPKPTPGKGRT